MLPVARQNLWLLSLLCALIAAAYLILEHSGPEPITELNPNKITRLNLNAIDHSPLTFNKNVDGWSLVKEGNRLPANELVIQRILQLAQAESLQQFPLKPADLPKYQLDNPRIIVSFDDIKIGFGDLDPINNLRYVLVGNRVHLIKDDYYRDLLSPEDKLIK